MRHHQACSRAHQVGALLLVAATFLLTRLFDRLLLDTSSSAPINPGRPSSSADLRIYVYAEDEIQGLRALLRGRDGTITAATCLKGDRTDKRGTSAFNTWKDIIIPGNVDDSMVKPDARAVQPIPLTKRKYLANFLGRAQGKVGRLQLVELAKQYLDKLESPELKLSGPNKLGRIEYFKHLRNAKFCLAPRGESSWTLRFYESFVECVLVILSDEVELPFQNVIDYSEISIKWPSSRIGPELLEYLESISADTEPCSAMSGILTELQKKVRRFHQSPETFWLHNRSVVNRDLIEFHSWRTPVPLP
ncbi:unnamed protein product [Miscanthus lutarioriparius]|uniref:Exostosin GT47 domain-containing protein n=1 Tax=Miscanthus lutarioriparius TaxID=422564 RepID=A0A811PA24_9POAL|nr:unnamed protein product [Miscanthus lutarioriparius]